MVHRQVGSTGGGEALYKQIVTIIFAIFGENAAFERMLHSERMLHRERCAGRHSGE